MIFDTILDGTEKEIRDLEFLAFTQDEEDVENSIVNIHLLLSDSILDEELVISACGAAKMLTNCGSPEEAEAIIDLWLEYFEDTLTEEEEEYGNYYTGFQHSDR